MMLVCAWNTRALTSSVGQQQRVLFVLLNHIGRERKSERLRDKSRRKHQKKGLHVTEKVL